MVNTEKIVLVLDYGLKNVVKNDILLSKEYKVHETTYECYRQDKYHMGLRKIAESKVEK